MSDNGDISTETETDREASHFISDEEEDNTAVVDLSSMSCDEFREMVRLGADETSRMRLDCFL